MEWTTEGEQLAPALLVANVLHEDAARDQLTAALVTLLQTQSTTSSATLQLYSTLTLLLSPIIHQPLAPIPPIASYLSQHLLPALTDDSALQHQLADIILDLVWQLDTQIDSAILRRPAPSASPAEEQQQQQPKEEQQQQVAMQVDEQQETTKEAKSETSEEDKKAAEAAKAKDEAARFLKLETAARERLADFVKLLLDANLLQRDNVTLLLDGPLLATKPLTLINDARSFNRMEIRARTALYYKQQKFNLLREESEGFSKLAVELLSNMGPAHSVVDAKSRETEKQRMDRARSVGDKVKNLIGNFDLDPDRTLDLILDTFSDQLVHHHQFFLDFLSISPWAPKPKSSPTAAGEMEVDGAGAGAEKGESKEWVDVGLEKDEGRSSMAQILGFKFEYYQKEGVEETPEKLYLLAGLLIYNGFVKLADLWPHLSPDDSVLSKLESKYRTEQEQLARSVGGANALAMAGALVDDDVPKPTTTSSTKTGAASSSAPPLPRILPNQKLGLLRALLSLGDVAHSLFILSQWPVLVAANPDLADLLNRLLSISIRSAYDAVSLAKSPGKEQWQAELTAVSSKHGLALGTKKDAPPPMRERYLSGRAIMDPHPSKEYMFFWARWEERIPKAGDAEEVLQVLEGFYGPMGGVWWSRDFGMYTRICRIIVGDLTATPPADNPRLPRYLSLLRQYLLPSLSLLQHHTPSAHVLWSLLSLLPMETRFALYGEWKDSLYRRIPALQVRKAEAERDIKSLLRRLSTENVKQLGKTIAKVAHTNPTIIFGVVLNQVQSYDNLIKPVVEAARYYTEFGYDVFAYSLLDALSSGKSKTKEDGTSVALWLQGLATFAGELYRRWASMAPSLWILLQYLVNQLASGNSKDLIILRELIGRMTAIEPFADLSDAQVLSLAGGKVLRNEVFQQTSLVGRVQMGQMATARERLTDSLKRSKLAVPLLVNIALQRKACVATESHLKSLGALYDQNHAVLFQYMELLTAISDPDDLAKMVPAASELMQRYGLDAAISFDIGRPKLRLAMKAHDEKEVFAQEQRRKAQLAAKLARERGTDAASSPKEASPAVVGVEGDGDVKMEEAGAATTKEDSAPGTPVPPAAASGDVAMVETNGVAGVVDAAAAKAAAPLWHPGLLDDIKRFEKILPAEVQAQLGTAFFVTFWQLTLFDIIYPKDRYDAEMQRCRVMQRESSANQLLKPDDRDKFVKGTIELASKLLDEAVEHQKAIKATGRRLTREAKAWFSNVKTKRDREVLISQIYQYCIEPRARLSLPDAVFAYQFIKKMHALNTSAFSTVMMFDKVLTSAVGPLLFACSENEARNFARFLFEMLSDVHAWYNSEERYKTEAIGAQLQGFARLSVVPTGPPTDFFPHETIQKSTKKWHAKMVDGFIASFESGEYMHIKNSILVLTKLAPVFPIEYATGIRLETSVADLLTVEKREDLTILAQGYKAVIAKRRKHWSEQPPKIVASPTPASPAAPKVSVSATTSPRDTPAPSGIPSRPSLLSTSSAPPPSAPTGPSVPTGPKHGLPTRPGQNNPPSGPARPLQSARPTESARPSEDDVKTKTEPKSNAMDVDKPIPTAPAASRPPPTEPARQAEVNGNSRNSHPSLPARPGTTNGSSTTQNSNAEKLRQEVFLSRNKNSSSPAPAATYSSTAPASSSTAMDPPPAPSNASGSRRPADLPPIPTAPRGAASRDDRRDIRDRRDDRDDRREPPAAAANTSRPPSRAPSPRGSDSGRRGGRDSDRERDSRSTRARSRSVESTHSGSRGSRSDRDPPRKEPSRSGSSRDDRDSRPSRSSRDDRDRPPHDAPRDRDRHRDRDGKLDERSSRRGDDDRRSSRNHDDRREHEPKGSSSRRDDDRRRDNDDRRRAEEDRRRGEEKKELPPRSRYDDRGPAAPTGPRSDRDSQPPRSAPTAPAGDRLKPAPAQRGKDGDRPRNLDAPKEVAKPREPLDKPVDKPKEADKPTPALPPSSALPAKPAPAEGIKIRGGGAGRLFASTGMSSGGGSSRRTESPQDSRGGSRGPSRDERNSMDDDRAGDNKKRSLTDRMESPSNPPKRPRSQSPRPPRDRGGRYGRDGRR